MADIYAPYAKETALCVEFAYDAFEEDLRTELKHAVGATEDVLKRLLKKIQERRDVLEVFKNASTASAI